MQVAGDPIYEGLRGAGQFSQVWIAHTIFALPLAIFLLHNFISEIPADVIEAARVDGASHGQIFFRIVLPLSLPAIASFAIFQFLWVWNDLLVALIFASGPAAPDHQSPGGAHRRVRAERRTAAGGRVHLDPGPARSCSSRCSATSCAACWRGRRRAEPATRAALRVSCPRRKSGDRRPSARVRPARIGSPEFVSLQRAPEVPGSVEP